MASRKRSDTNSNKCVSVDDDAERERSIFSPVRKLPSELRSEVFVYCGSDGNTIRWTPSDNDIMRQPAWAVSSTCWQWRLVALSCKPLWANICLDLPLTSRNSIPIITSESLKLLRATTSWQQLSTCLLRSSEHPLTLEIRNCDMSSVPQLLLLRDSHASRWKHLHLVSPQSPYLPSFIGTCFPVLQTIQISQSLTGTERYLHDFRDAPLLRRIQLATLDGWLLELLSPIRLPREQLSHLTHLTVKYSNAPIFTEGNTLRHCSNLENLQVLASHSGSAPSNIPTSSIRLPKLQTLAIAAYGNSLVANYNAINCILSTFIFPSLMNLELSTHNKSFQGTWSQSKFEAFIHRSQCSVTTLKLDGMTLSPDEVKSLLSALPTVRELTMNDSRCWLEEAGLLMVTSQVLANLIANNKGDTLLPNLESLVLRSCCQTNTYAMSPAFSRMSDIQLADMIKSRRLPGSVLRTVSLTYLSAGRVMDGSAQITLECLRDLGLEFSWVSEVEIKDRR